MNTKVTTGISVVLLLGATAAGTAIGGERVADSRMERAERDATEALVAKMKQLDQEVRTRYIQLRPKANPTLSNSIVLDNAIRSVQTGATSDVISIQIVNGNGPFSASTAYCMSGTSYLVKDVYYLDGETGRISHQPRGALRGMSPHCGTDPNGPDAGVTPTETLQSA